MGPRCENETNECVPDPCKNGATCEDLPLAFTCHCVDGKNFGNPNVMKRSYMFFLNKTLSSSEQILGISSCVTSHLKFLILAESLPRFVPDNLILSISGTNGNLCENIIPFCVPTNYDGQWAENPCKKKDGEAKCVEKIGGS